MQKPSVLRGLSLGEVLRQYGSEAQCRRAFYRARWPKGLRCPACGDRRRTSFLRGAQTIYQCRACQQQSTHISFRRITDADPAHAVLVAGGGRAATEVKGARWVSVIFGDVKRAVGGVYHAARQAKYARRYVAEAAYRVNRRFRLRDMAPRIAHALIACKPCPEPTLRLACNFLH